MAIGGEVVFTGIPNLLAIYNSAPWIFDGIMLCSFLGLLFRNLVQKANIGKDSKQNAKIGSILGFFLGLALTGYLEMRGWHLFTEGGPWVLGTIVILLAMMLWAVTDNYFEGKHRTTTILIFFVAVMLALWAFSHTLPSFNTSLNAMGQWRWLLYLAFWCALIFILIYALLGAFGFSLPGTTPPGTTPPAAPGTPAPAGKSWWSKLWPGNWFKRTPGAQTPPTAPGAPTPPTAPETPGAPTTPTRSRWWPPNWFRRKATPTEPGAPGAAPTKTQKEVEAEGPEIDKTQTEIDKAAIEAEGKAEAARNAANKLAMAKETAEEQLENISRQLIKKKNESATDYKKRIQAMQKAVMNSISELNSKYKYFLGINLSKSFRNYYKTCAKIITIHSRLAEKLKKHIASFAELRNSINAIENPIKKEDFINRLRDNTETIQSIAASLNTHFQEFEKQIPSLEKMTQLKELEDSYTQIESDIERINTLFGDIVSQMAIVAANMEKGDETKANTAIAGITDKIIVETRTICYRLNQLLNESFQDDITQLSQTILGMQKITQSEIRIVLHDLLGTFRAAANERRALEQEISAQFSIEKTAREKEAAELREKQDINAILKRINNQRTALTLLYVAARKYIEGLSYYAAQTGLKEFDKNNFKAQYKKIKNAANITLEKEIQPLSQGENTAKLAFENVKKAIALLESYKQYTTKEEMPRIDAVQSNLKKYMGYEGNVKAVLNNFDAALLNHIEYHIKRGMRTVNTLLAIMENTIKTQESWLNLLDTMPILEVLRREEMPTPERKLKRLKREEMPKPKRRT